jgi:methyltransferase (TIGR00027 family)
VEQGKFSRTALRVATRRAAHQVLDRPLILDDPLAIRIIGRDEVSKLARDSDADDAAARGMRAFMAVRSRFAEDELAKAIAAGTKQYVVLGAGLETFAYRNPHPGLRVFEVDHPATQAWKRELLQTAGIAIPTNAVFVPVDFERETLSAGLERGGFREDRPAFFSWLGVVPYLSERAFEDTLSFIAALPKPSGVVFDYGVARSALSWKERVMLDILAARVAAAGEPFRLFFEPAQLAAKLRETGFSYIEDLGSEEINGRYFTGRTDGLQLKSNLGRLLSARS